MAETDIFVMVHTVTLAVMERVSESAAQVYTLADLAGVGQKGYSENVDADMLGSDRSHL